MIMRDILQGPTLPIPVYLPSLPFPNLMSRRIFGVYLFACGGGDWWRMKLTF